MPKSLEDLDVKIKAKEQQQKKLLSLKPIVDIARTIRTKELPDLNEELNRFNSDFKKVQNEVAKVNYFTSKGCVVTHFLFYV